MLFLLWRRVLAPFLAVLVLAAGSSALPARAQEASEPAEYRSTIREALAEYNARNFPEARALFEEAHRLLPNARTLRGLGMTAFELRSYRESVHFLQAALAAQAKPLEGSLRLETERLLRRAERFVAKLTLTLEPSDARVQVDGAPVEVEPGQPLLLEIGAHTIEFSAEGYAPETRTLNVQRRENESWSIVLQRLPEPPPVVTTVPTPAETAESALAIEAPEDASAPIDSAPSARRPLRKNPWLWTGVGAVVVAGVVTAVVLATRDPGVGPVRAGDNTPPEGVFTALRSQP